MDCPLCRPNLSAEEHDNLWNAMRDKGYETAIIYAEENGMGVTIKDLRAHFEYHYPVQARPENVNLDKKFLKEMDEMIERRAKMIDLVWRIPSLTGESIGRLIYWNGDPDKLISADKAALRDLKKLMYRDYIHRVFLNNLVGPIYKPTLLKGMYFLGRRGAVFLEDRLGREVKDTEFLTHNDAAKEWPIVFSMHQSHMLMSQLHKELPGSSGLRWKYLKNDLALGWDQNNWIGRHLLPRYEDPIRKSKKLEADGLAAFTARKGNTEPNLFPFLYYHDNASVTTEKLVERVTRVFDFERSNVQNWFPDFPHDMILPSIIICKDQATLDRLTAVTNKISTKEITVIACVENVFDLFSPVWKYLFHNKNAAPISLSDALFKHYRRGGIEGTQLNFKRNIKQLPK